MSCGSVPRRINSQASALIARVHGLAPPDTGSQTMASLVDPKAPLDVGVAGAQLVERGCLGAVDGFMHRGHSARARGG